MYPAINLKIVIFTILILLIVISGFIISRLIRTIDFTDNIQFTDYPRYNTGDIICVSYDSLRGGLVKIFTGSAWTHIGLIVKTKNSINVVEVAHYEDWSGVTWRPLDKWLDLNNGRIIAIRKYQGKKFPGKKLLQKIKETEHYKPDLNVINWLNALRKINYRPQNKLSYYCSEYICHLLQEIGVMKKIYLPSGYKPWELLYGELPLEEFHHYSNPFILNY